MRKSHKKQHWVPQSYLVAWNDPDCPPTHTPFINLIKKDGSSVRQKAAINVFNENDLYTITTPSGQRDLTLEHGLGGLENAFSQIRRDFLSRRKKLPVIRFHKLLAFVSAMQARTPVMRNHHGKFWKKLKDKGDDMLAHVKSR